MTAASLRGIAALALLCAAVNAPAAGQQTESAQDKQQKEHTVRKGDTLWDLAQFYLNDPFRWPAIYEANRSVVENPHWIYPKERLVIVIPGVAADGKPSLVLADAGPTAAVEHTRFYVPTRTYDGATLISSESAAVPLVQPHEWLAAPYIDATKKPQLLARVLKAADPRIETDKLDPFFHPQDKLFLGTKGATLKKGDQLLAVRYEEKLGGYGWVVRPQAVLRVDSLGQRTALATVVTQFGDLKLDDAVIALPVVPAMPADRLTEVTGGPEGKVIEFLVEQPIHATTDYAFVNVGAAKGLALGDELLAYLPPRKPGWGAKERLTEQPVARLRVIRVTENTATVRVTRVANAVLERGVPVRVVRVAR